MPSKVHQKHPSKKQKKSEDAVALFRREVEEQERLVEALRSHQQDRTDRIERIKSLLASGSELASAVGVWENPSNNKKTLTTTPTKTASVDVYSDPNAALTETDDCGTGPLDTNGKEATAVATADDNDADTDSCGDTTAAARVSEIKGLAADMMQAVMEEFGGYMAGMDRHRAILEGLKGTSQSTTNISASNTVPIAVAAGDVDAEEEAALQELVEFRQRMRDNKKMKRQRNKKKKKGTSLENAANADGSAVPNEVDSSAPPQSSSPNAELYISLLDRLVSGEGGGALSSGHGGALTSGHGGLGGHQTTAGSPDWLLDGFEPAVTSTLTTNDTSEQKGETLTATASTAPTHGVRTREVDTADLNASYSDDFEEDA